MSKSNHHSLKWFLIGFGSAWGTVILILALLFLNGESYNHGVFGHMQNALVPLSERSLIMHVHEPTNVFHEVRFGAPGHLLVLLRADQTWTNVVAPPVFSPFDEFVFASDPEKNQFWLIDSENGKWVEWDIQENRFHMADDAAVPEFDEDNRYLTVK